MESEKMKLVCCLKCNTLYNEREERCPECGGTEYTEKWRIKKGLLKMVKRTMEEDKELLKEKARR